MSSTTEHQDYADIDGQTPAMLRHNLRRARERIATLIGMLDEERAKHAETRAELRRLRARMNAATKALSGYGGRPD